jgi:hypothetical protein
MKKKNPKKDNKRQNVAVKRMLRERARKQEAKTKVRKPSTFVLSPTSPPKKD